MYITPVHTKTKDGKISHTCWLMRHSVREGKKVKTQTLLNLTRFCTDDEITAIRLALKHKNDLSALKSVGDIELRQGPSVGVVWLLHQLARETGLSKALGSDRDGLLALWQVMARIIDQGSRLSGVRLAGTHAACDILGLRESFNEDDLYANLSWLCQHQERIEKRLYRHRHGSTPPVLFLYDVTSSYLEGAHNALADWGYNRDGKKGKRQIVVGLMCDACGDPISIEVFSGNTSDPKTVKAQIDKAANRFGCQRVIFVGDRGMIKSGSIKELGEAGFSYITAITKPQIEALIRQDVFQLDLFSDALCEVVNDGIRYILRRNPHRVKELEQQRQSKQAVIEALLGDRNAYLRDHKRAQVEVALGVVQKRIKRLKIDKWVSVEATDRTLKLVTDMAALAELTRLDGCYVIKSDVAVESADTQTVHDRYKELKLVESAFRTCKTGFLELRPWNVRTEESTRGHAFVVMLAYLLVRRLVAAWKTLNVTVEEGIHLLTQLCAITVQLPGANECYRLPKPTELQHQLFTLANIPVPEVVPKLNVNVVSRKKLVKKT